MGQDRLEIEFFGNFILCTNNENNFIQIDQGEIRYRIRKLPILTHDNKNLLDEFKKEIPFFIHYLIERSFTTRPTTRIWFRTEQITTAALKKIMRNNRNKIEAEMAQLILNILDHNDDVEAISFCLTDIQDWLYKKSFRGHDSIAIKRVLQEEWNLEPSANSNTYQQYRLGTDGTFCEYIYKGRFYKVTKKMILELNHSDDSNIID